LETFLGLGIKLAIATNKPTENATLLLTKTKIRNFFFHIQGSDGLEPKPNPEILLKALQVCNASHAIMIGDRVEDIRAATAIGIKSIGVAQTSHRESQFMDAGATYSFNGMKHFAEHLAFRDFLDSLFA
jgi:phosphoglycolate phosphatase-like HAD superfamily hydrolase